jgi:hypothetical protein
MVNVKYLRKEKLIEDTDCPTCKKPVLTVKGEGAVAIWDEAEHSIDGGEFSNDTSAWDDFCDGHEIEDSWLE